MNNNETVKFSHKMLKEVEKKIDKINVNVENIKAILDLKQEQKVLVDNGKRVL